MTYDDWKTTPPDDEGPPPCECVELPDGEIGRCDWCLRQDERERAIDQKLSEWKDGGP